MWKAILVAVGLVFTAVSAQALPLQSEIKRVVEQQTSVEKTQFFPPPPGYYRYGPPRRYYAPPRGYYGPPRHYYGRRYYAPPPPRFYPRPRPYRRYYY